MWQIDNVNLSAQKRDFLLASYRSSVHTHSVYQSSRKCRVCKSIFKNHEQIMQKLTILEENEYKKKI